MEKLYKKSTSEAKVSVDNLMIGDRADGVWKSNHADRSNSFLIFIASSIHVQNWCQNTVDV